jgi:uncharacterized protein (DUF1697 family)
MARTQSSPTRYVALLRAVNLAGRNQVSMAALRNLLTDLHLGDPRTLLQSGNIVFRSQRRNAGELEGVLETELARRLGLTTHFFVRSADEWQQIVSGNPFPAEAERDPGHLLVVVFKQPTTAAAVQELQAAITGREVVRGIGRHVYIVYPDGVGRSRLTNALIEKKLGTSGTGRNWNTVLKLQAIVSNR